MHYIKTNYGVTFGLTSHCVQISHLLSVRKKKVFKNIMICFLKSENSNESY